MLSFAFLLRLQIAVNDPPRPYDTLRLDALTAQVDVSIFF